MIITIWCSKDTRQDKNIYLIDVTLPNLTLPYHTGHSTLVRWQYSDALLIIVLGVTFSVSQVTFNVYHSTFNNPGITFNVYHSTCNIPGITFNVSYSTCSIQLVTFNLSYSRCSIQRVTCNIQGVTSRLHMQWHVECYTLNVTQRVTFKVSHSRYHIQRIIFKV